MAKSSSRNHPSKTSNLPGETGHKPEIIQKTKEEIVINPGDKEKEQKIIRFVIVRKVEI